MTSVRRLAVCLGCCVIGLAVSPVIALGALSGASRELGGSLERGLLGGSAGTEATNGGSGGAGASEGLGGGSGGSVPSEGSGSEASGEAGGNTSRATTEPPPGTTMALASPFQGEVVLSPEQVEADTQSRSAFTGLGREAAVVLAERSFHIETPSWTAPGSEAGSKIAQYLSANTASEERPSGKHVLVQSTLPLRVDNGVRRTDAGVRGASR